MLQNTSTTTLLGSGTSSEVFRVAPDRVLKLFWPGVPERLAEREALVAAHAAGHGLPTPLLIGRERRGDRHALLFEHVPGRTLLATYRYRFFGALAGLRRLAAVQAAVNRTAPPPGLQRQRDVLERQLRDGSAPAAERAAALALLSGLPDADRLCHGDLHPGNAMVRPDGGVMLIDWCKASAGNPAADACRSELLIRFAGHGSRTRLLDRALDMVRDLLGWWYVRCYARAAGIDVSAIRAWRLPLAIAWSEGHRTTRAAAFAAFVRREMRRAAR